MGDRNETYRQRLGAAARRDSLLDAIPPSVIPAKVGIQGERQDLCVWPWIPAFAGMTKL
jgi:hypothetical protein